MKALSPWSLSLIVPLAVLAGACLPACGGDDGDNGITCSVTVTLGTECKKYHDKLCACSTKGVTTTAICKDYANPKDGKYCSAAESSEEACKSVNSKSSYDYCKDAKS